MTRNINVNLFRDDTSGSKDEIPLAVTNFTFWVVMCCPGPSCSKAKQR